MSTASHQVEISQNQLGVGSAGVAIAWLGILMGAVSGLIMGLWSFDGPFPTPDWIGGYDELPRRFLRLAHVAFFALSILHFLVARQIRSTPLSPNVDTIALWSMAFGNIAMPVFLIAAAIWEPAKYLTSLPATALTYAFAVTATGAIQNCFGGAK